MKELEKTIISSSFYSKLFGDDNKIIEAKKIMLEIIWRTFKNKFLHIVDKQKINLISVPNRVELIGKHTDYQGGETFLLAGPKNIFAISALSCDGTSEIINADPGFGKTILKLHNRKPEMIAEGEGSNYTYTVAKRLFNNLSGSGFMPLKNVKSVFMGDIPFGGGTSGSSSKLIADFFIFATANCLVTSRDFISLVIENGMEAGIKMDQKGVDNFSLALSMYLAHFENGLDFGDLKGDRGVGTFGGSEDHTAILLGEKGSLLYCRYCPTKVLDRVKMPEDYKIVVAYSGKKAEKTKNALARYNRLSKDAFSCVSALNEINKTNFKLLREFFKEQPLNERAEVAYEQLLRLKKDLHLAERAYQFFKEREITCNAVLCIKKGDIDKFGRLINESHLLSKRYLKNIVEEIDFLQKSANQLGAVGSTGFGAGFGGSCYAIINESQLTWFIEKWKDGYIKRFPQYKDVTQFDVYPASMGYYWGIYNG